MKKLLTCFFALCIIAPAAIADNGAISRILPTAKSDTDTASEATSVSRTTVARTATRASDTIKNTANQIFTGTPQKVARTATISRALRTDDTDTTNTTTERTGAISRSSIANRKKTELDGLDAAVNTVGRNARVSAASINNNPALRRAGVTLRPSTAEVGGRATIAGTDTQTGSNIDEAVRGITARATTATRESITAAKETLEATAELNASCQQQYNDCMDQFCMVIDANQGRCSCSSNITKYAKVESAVKEANAQLNEVAQNIRYVGLSADEIRAIMNETEAEEALSGAKDTSETRNMLEEIEELIMDPTSTSSYYSSGGSMGLDLDLNFSSDSADMFSLDFLNTDTNSSFSNLRGAELYNAARKRCNTVLTQCKKAGATVSQVTGNYDVSIDKDCIAYEQGLKKMNDTLASNVRSANLMLQKARLAVLQNKNQYDAKGCIGALETCMKDDMVCGDNYYKCIDPTKRYIDENGEVVLGQNITKITDFMTEYDNSLINAKNLKEDYAMQISDELCSVHGENNTAGGDGSCVVQYLLKKIGTGQKVTEEGLCRAVLDKCQNYTYNGTEYKPYNDVVVNYIQRAMVNIRAAQRKIIAEYASNCMVDIATCYNQQVTQVNAWSSNASVNSVYNVMRGACRNVALTCAYAVFEHGPTVCVDGTCSENTNELCPNNDDDKCINSISEMFYQSLLCPDNSSYNATTTGTTSPNGTKEGWVNAKCKCNTGFVPWNGNCIVECADGQTYNTYGLCVQDTTTVNE